MSTSISLHFSQTFNLFELPIPLSYPKNRSRTSAVVSLPSQNTQKSTASLKTKIPISTEAKGPDKKFQIQPLIYLLRDSADEGSLKQAKSVHGFVLKSSFSDKELLILLNHVAHAYSKCSDLSSAFRVFDKMSQRNIFSWTVMIASSTENGFFLDGFKYFYQMLSYGVLPDTFAYSAIMQTSIGLECIELGRMVHAQIVIRGFHSHTFVATSLLNMYAKLRSIEDSYEVFNTMTEHNEVSWNAIISGFTLSGMHLESFDHFLRMKNEGIMVNAYTLISVSKAVGQLSDIDKGKEVQSVAVELGMESDVQVNMPWNAMISGYSQNGCSQEALKLYFGKQVHGMVWKSGCYMMVISVCNAIADAYAKCGALEDVKKIFYRMEERDIVSWTTLVTAHSQSLEWEEALTIFSQMREEGFRPNQFTFSSVLVSCSSLCFLEYGRQVHGLLCKAGLATDKCIESALVDMYAKCGSAREAEKVFERILNPDTVSWTAMISGYGQHGLSENALKLFKRMEQLGMKVNSVTLLCVLFACSHGGLVEQGLKYFQEMEQNYGLVPEMEHYACIVDLFGRVGRFDDAMEFIGKMPIEPSEMIWQTLLGACRVHGIVELGEIAAQKVLSVRPDSAAYILLSNTYIESGSFDDGLNLRKVMRQRGVKKEPGYSWISVQGKVHKFYSGDHQHPQKDDIYAKLEELMNSVKSMGYIPDLNIAL
ncbi:putative pentatricopeptide repeat-containing protein At5g59200, chloroplastic isoform X5 [Mangifera indica]|uniref:putative pentatricopeptide repeat-containing protein At5g59200, chloroplastic isoform X5 n=1 Tax=Mangifera indica TaxID=29780 RepID=UPI001CFA0846|nr:putative pentatricopeptide repeat-containing protein At5g59200, chloroplastic isoform X5 [Mangifera indica]